MPTPRRRCGSATTGRERFTRFASDRAQARAYEKPHNALFVGVSLPATRIFAAGSSMARFRRVGDDPPVMHHSGDARRGSPLCVATGRDQGRTASLRLGKAHGFGGQRPHAACLRTKIPEDPVVVTHDLFAGKVFMVDRCVCVARQLHVVAK